MSLQPQWTDDEIAQVAFLAAPHHACGDLLLCEAVDRAQREVLPESHWRAWDSNVQVISYPKLYEAIKAREAELTLAKSNGARNPAREGLPKYTNKGVIWGPQELEQIAVAASDHLREGHDILTAVLLAQEDVLPEGRRRKVTVLSKPLQSQIRTLAVLPPRASAKKPEPIVEQVAETAPSTDLQSLILRMDRRLANIEATQTQGRAPTKADPDDFPTIVLCGLRAEEFREIERKFGGNFYLHNVPLGDVPPLDLLSKADRVVACTTTLNSSSISTLKQATTPGCFLRAYSPIAGMNEVLTGLLHRPKSAHMQHALHH